jgi:hypothetical protein
VQSQIRAVLVFVMALALSGAVCTAAPRDMRKKVWSVALPMTKRS